MNTYLDEPLEEWRVKAVVALGSVAGSIRPGVLNNIVKGDQSAEFYRGLLAGITHVYTVLSGLPPSQVPSVVGMMTVSVATTLARKEEVERAVNGPGGLAR